MTADFVEIAPTTLRANPFQSIGKDWMLITAGPMSGFNAMTASWGAWGELWNRPVAICFVRPQRYTYGFMERAEYYTLTYFETIHRTALDYCGSHSGRDVDKMAATGLTPVATPSGAVAYEQARFVLECRKLYAGNFQESDFVDPTVAPELYASKDFHRMYVGEVVRCWTKGA